MNIAKLSKSIIKRKIITSILTISLILCSFSVAFATEVNQETLYPLLKTNTTYYAYRYNGGSTSIARNTGIADEIGYFLQNLTETNQHLYSVLDGVEGYIDGIEGSLTNINNKLPASTWYSNITSYLDGVEGYIDGIESSLNNIDMNTDGLEGYVDGVESKLDNINNSIQSNNNSTSIGNIETYAHNIQYILDGSSSGIYTLVDSLGDSLTYINSSIGTGGSGNSVLDKLSGVLANQNSINNNLGYWNGVDSTSVAESAYNIAENTSVLNVINEILTSISAIDTNINYDTIAIHNDTTGIHNDTTGIHNDTTVIHSDTTELIDKVESFTNDYNNINWSLLNIPNNGYTVSTTLNGSNITNAVYTRSIYYNFSNINILSDIIKIELPIFLYSTPNISNDFDIDIGFMNGSEYIDAKYDYEYYVNSATPFVIYVDLTQYKHNNLTLCIKNQYFRVYNEKPNIYYINDNNQDYFNISNWIAIKSIHNLFEQAKEMFFDDESLKAKKDNAGQTTAVITGFTGSGQASASVNDYGTLSNGVSDVKGGMNTNVNASSAFGIFNNQSGYSFWSTETLQELNSSGSNTRNLSKSNDDDGYVYYNGRLEYLLNAMIGDDKK